MHCLPLYHRTTRHFTNTTTRTRRPATRLDYLHAKTPQKATTMRRAPTTTHAQTAEWETPQPFFDRLDREFHFTLDAAATAANAKCPAYFTPDDDALNQPWTGTVWCNPPYGGHLPPFVKKAYQEAQKGATVVMLILASTDSNYWHDYVMKAKEIRFLKGRITFTNHANEKMRVFPTVVVVFTQGNHRPHISTIEAQ